MFNNQEFWGILLIAALFEIRSRIRSHLIHYPATLLHELAHLVLAKILRGGPQRFTITPKKQDDGTVVLGSVSCAKIIPLNAFPISLAPLVMIPLAYALYSHWHIWFPNNMLYSIGLYFVMFLLLTASMPSSTDWKLAFRDPVVGICWTGVVAIGCWIVR